MAGNNAPELSLAVFIIRVVSPALVFLATLSLIFSRAPSPTSPSPITSVVVATRVPRRALVLSLLSLASFTFLLDGLTFVVYAVLTKSWPQNTGIEINAIVGIVAYSGLAAFGTWKDVHDVPVWSLKRVKAAIAIALLLDIAHVVLLGLLTTFHKGSGPYSSLSISALLHLVFPAFRVLLLVPLFFGLISPRIIYTPVDTGDDTDVYDPTDSTFLLPPGGAPPSSTGLSSVPGLSGEASKYGTFQSAHPAIPPSGPATRAHTPVGHHKPDEKPDVALDPSWRELGRRLRRIGPYLWPSKSASLQFVAFLCVLLLIVGRVVNFLLPWTLGELVRVFETPSNRSPWLLLFGYVGLRFLQSGGGLGALRDSLWAPVMQYSDREMSQLSFDHLLNLSFAFHMRRKTGELLRILDRGAAINHTLELILFSIIPTFLDIIVALIVFAIRFEWSLMAVILCVMTAYVWVSVIMTKWRTQVRRRMNDRDMVTRGIHTDCLLNYETVKYFGGEQHEGERYRNAIRDYQVLEYRVMLSLNMLNLAQNFIITLGLLVGSMIVASRVTKGESEPSDFVFFITYIAQLYGPLNNLGYVYRSVNQSLVDTERLLKLLNEPKEVEDNPDAPDLIVEDGEIEFDDVSFSYDNRSTALNGVSFKVPKGSSVALVGESGAGKSTILRLLYRFYDLKEGEGRILIDGQNIKDVTQRSLRKAIGVVPQDCVLFNTSIGYNIGYGKFDASSEEIEIAAQGAQMHDRIMSFPDGYDTDVGERGVRLSGGEKQRVAIARTLLKNPPILLLDEATSALDTSTEKDIQKALQNLQRGRSSLSIAHRLSTIASADVILVLKNGQIIEQGSHRELLAQDGVFAAMWADQVSTSGDPTASIGDQSVKKDAVSGHFGDQTETMAQDGVEDQAREHAVSDAFVDTSEAAPADLPSTEDSGDALPVPSQESVASQADESVAPASLAFPTSDSTKQSPSERTVSQSQSGGGVTFEDSANAPPSRSATPDPDAEPKRKRIASQNFQRFARKISLTTRRQGSGSFIPGIKRDDSSTQQPPQDGTSARNSNDSNAASLQSDIGKKKKDKKEKRKSIF